MKKLVYFSTLICAIWACNNAPKPTVEAGNAVASAPQTNTDSGIVYTLDTATSLIRWEGYEGLALGKSEHNGTLALNSGSIRVHNNQLTGGTFSIAVASLQVLDIPTHKPGNAKLSKHLLGTDFFDAANHPNINFEITNTATVGNDSVRISGNLTLKGVSKSITFTAAVQITEQTVTAIAPKFYINRKDWGMHYRSENSLGDEMIRSELGIAINLMAKK